MDKKIIPIGENTNFNVTILMCSKISLGRVAFKYFIGYKDNDKVKPLYIIGAPS